MGDTASDRPKKPDRERSNSEEEGLTGRTLTPDGRPSQSEEPDVYLDIPLLKVDEISFELENLEAHVSLVAQVLDLLKLNVGADAFLGRVNLEIKGVEAQAQLKVRLDNVAVILDRVLTTLDRNPEILRHLAHGVEAAARDIGAGTGTAVGEVGRGAKGAVEDVGRGAGGAVENVGEGAGGAVKDVGKGAGGVVESVGEGAGGAVEGVGKGAGEGVRDVGKGTGGAVEDVGKGAGRAAETAGEDVTETAETAGKTAEGVTGATDEGGTADEGETTDEGGTADDENAEPDQAGGDDEDGSGDEPVEEPEKDQAPSPGDGEAAGGDQEITALQSALRETEESVRDLGRALLRMVSHQPHSSRGGGD